MEIGENTSCLQYEQQSDMDQATKTESDHSKCKIATGVKHHVLHHQVYSLSAIEECPDKDDSDRPESESNKNEDTKAKQITECSLAVSPETSDKSQVPSTSIEDKREYDTEDSFIVGRSIKTKVLHRINYGAYGSIHTGIFLKTDEKVAVKLEPLKSNHPQLLAEGATMRHLENGPGIPTIKWFGSYEPKFNVMVMDLLGPSIQQLLALCGHKFTLKTVLMLADQMLETMDFIHSKDYVHRDIKPDNFVIGRPGTEKENQIYLLDFGLAKKFHRQRFSVPVISSAYLVHPLAGTIRYMGLHAHEGLGDQPRDDLESLSYVFIYLFKGRLPWQGIKGCKSKEEKIAQVRKMKATISPSELCSDMPEQFAAFVDKCRRSRVYDAESSAKNWRKIFRKLGQSLNIEYDNRFDWVVKKEESGLDFIEEAFKTRGHASS